MNRTVYNMINITDSCDEIISHDLFFIAAGSDYRAYEILRKAKKNNVNFKNIVMVDFNERNIDASGEYKKQYYEYRTFKNFNFIEIDASIKDPSGFIKHLKTIGLQISKMNSIGIDISCFTKPYFFSFLKYLHIVEKINNIEVSYTEPKSYIFKNGLYDSYKSSSGPIRVEELPAFAGSSFREQDRLLVVLLGFAGDISREINEDVAPNSTLIINGFPGYAPKFKDISLVNNEKLVTNENIELLYCKANNPFETYNSLDKLKNKYQNNTFINIAPLGTKPMALGACLFAIHNPDVRVIYPIPENYENITTSDCWLSWRYSIPLNLN